MLKKGAVLILLSIFSSMLFASFASSISLSSLSELYDDDTLRIFEFIIVNDDGVTLNTVNWTLDTGDGYIINGTQAASLADGENMSVFVEYNFSARQTFTINATAYNGTITDSQTLQVYISDIVVTDFSYLYLNETEFIFEIVVNNTAASTLTDINWSLDMGDGYMINNTNPFNLTSNEAIRIYVNYNYTTVGSYDVTARAYDSNNDYSTVLSIKTNTSPVISPALPDVSFLEDGWNDTIDLDDYVSDEDADADLVWTVSGNSSSTVQVEILDDRRVNVTSANNYYTAGIEIMFTVTDNEGLINNDTILVTVLEQNDPPEITWYTPYNNITQFIPTGGQLLFNHTSIDSDIGDIITYNWSLDGIQQATTQVWTYQPTIADAGGHIINLTVYDQLNWNDSVQWDVTVYISYCDSHYNTSDGDWIVSSDVKCENETIPMDADIIVQNGGNLTLKNITIKMNNTIVDGDYRITVQTGGEMNVLDLDDDKTTTKDRSIIQRGAAFGYIFVVDSGATFKMKNSKINGSGFNKNNMGLEIIADNSIIENNEITNNYVGIMIDSDNNLIKDNNISYNTREGIYVNNFVSHQKIIGNTMANNDVGLYLYDSQFNNITDTRFLSNNVGLLFRNGTGTIEDGSHHNIIQDCVISNTVNEDIKYSKVSWNNSLINTTFDNTKLDLDGGDSNLTVKWYLDVYVNDSNGNNPKNTIVKGYDNNNNLIFSVATDTNGNILRQTLEEYTRFKDGAGPTQWHDVHKTNYTITASNKSHEATTSVNLTESKSITLTVAPLPLYIHNLSVLNIEGLNRTFEFMVTSQWNVNLTDVSFNFDTDDNNIITSSENIILTPGETIFAYLKYNFSSTGTYNINATAVNGTLTDSEEMSITIS